MERLRTNLACFGDMKYTLFAPVRWLWISALSSAALFLFAFSSSAQVNFWTKPTSGFWEEPFWSLGTLPGPGQDVRFNNPNWKALAIRAATAQNFPQSLTVQEITVASPVDSVNTLILEHSGFQVPLRATTLTIWSNSFLLTLGSAIHVTNSTGGIAVGGTVNHGNFSDVRAGFMHLGDFLGPGVYNFSNGTVNAGHLLIGDEAYFNQEGGSNNVGWLQFRNAGQYWLRNGDLVVGQSSIGDGSSGEMHQLGGNALWTNNISIPVNFGVGLYELTGGTVTANRIYLAGSGIGSFVQSGGTNDVGEVLINHGSSAHGSYTLSGGVLRVSGTTRGGFMSQHGGTFTTDSLVVRDSLERAPIPGSYTLGAGMLRAGRLSLGGASFTQNGGTNVVDGNVVLETWLGPPTRYTLNGGTLITSNTVVSESPQGGILQTGGLHQVQHTLDLFGYRFFPDSATYDLRGGELRVADVQVKRGIFRHSGGMLQQTGIFTLADGTYEANAGLQQLGRLQVSDWPFDTWLNTIAFPANAATLRFQQSSGLTWSNSVLVIEGWNGSTNGGGFQQLFIGSSASGVTAQQLSQIQFVDPAGFAAGNYPARILATGEIVPATRPTLRHTRNGSNWTLQWEAGYTLQSTTNLLGAWEDVPGAASPFQLQMNEPQRYFRLRR